MMKARPRAYPLSNTVVCVQPSRGGQAKNSMADLFGFGDDVVRQVRIGAKNQCRTMRSES
jgi:hypothetical protein